MSPHRASSHLISRGLLAPTWREHEQQSDFASWYISFTASCCWCLPSLHLKLRACLPRMLTADPQPQEQKGWGPRIDKPGCKHTATLTASSSILKPRAVNGKALSQATNSLVETESRRVYSSLFSACYNNRSAAQVAHKLSHDYCLRAAAPSGGWRSCKDLLHDIKVMKEAAKAGVILNLAKCEIISRSKSTYDTLVVVPPFQAQLLWSPPGDDLCISAVLTNKVEALRALGAHLKFCLPMMHCFCCKTTLPSQSCCMFAARPHVLPQPFWSLTMTVYVNSWAILPIPVWKQVVQLGRKPPSRWNSGVCSTVEVAPSAFLALAHFSSELVNSNFPPSFRSLPTPWMVLSPPLVYDIARNKHRMDRPKRFEKLCYGGFNEKHKANKEIHEVSKLSL